MPYHDTFYTAQNIIGYTGALHDFPTVYFRCDRRNLIGRITQRHPYPQNVGRNRPSTSIGYTMGNEMTANGMRLVERHPNGRTHTSRNIFHSIETGQTGQRHGGNIAEIANSLKTLAILAQAIRNCPNAKWMHGLSDASRDIIDASHRARMAGLREMMWNNRVMGGLRPSEVAHNAGLLPHLRADPRTLTAHNAALQNRGR